MEKRDVTYWNNYNRRSGRTKIIIAHALVLFLENGMVTITDHPHSNHTKDFYKSFIVREFVYAVAGLLQMPKYEVVKLLHIEYIYERLYPNRCLGIQIEALNKGKFQY